MATFAERVRAALVVEVNADPRAREELEVKYGRVWDTHELAREFVVIGFCAPFAVVRRKSDGRVGSLMFQHAPRFYFGYEEHRL
jgi:hypothetical protein